MSLPARQASRYTVLCMTALAAALLTLNQTSAQIVLEGGRRAYPLAAGMALYLAEAPTLAGETRPGRCCSRLAWPGYAAGAALRVRHDVDQPR